MYKLDVMAIKIIVIANIRFHTPVTLRMYMSNANTEANRRFVGKCIQGPRGLIVIAYILNKAQTIAIKAIIYFRATFLMSFNIKDYPPLKKVVITSIPFTEIPVINQINCFIQ